MSQLATVQTNELSAHGSYTDRQIDILKNSIAKGCDDSQFGLFMTVCEATGLNPFARQIYPVLRKNKKTGQMDMTIQTGIDGLRLIAQRSGEYEGQGEIQWCGPDGQWKDVWLEDSPPMAAKASVCRKGFREPLSRTVLYKSYCQMYQGSPMGLWKTMGEHMLGKCAEAAAIRAAFPQETSGIYTSDEMAQASNQVIDVTPEPQASTLTASAIVSAGMQETGHTATEAKALAELEGLPTSSKGMTPEQAHKLVEAMRADLNEKFEEVKAANLAELQKDMQHV